MKTALLYLATLTTCLAAPRPMIMQEWTWILGQLEDERAQEQYEAYARVMFDFYQERGSMPGTLVQEAQLDERPSEKLVHIGPLEAFRHPDWLVPPFEEVGEASFTVGGETFETPRAGLYLKDQAAEHVVFTGLSLEGFRDIFGTRTGPLPFTATLDGQRRYEGSYVDGAIEVEMLPYLPLFPTPSELEVLDELDGAVEVVSLYARDSAEELSAAAEAGLLELTEDCRVLFVGETHWNVGVNAAFNRLLPLLLEERALRTVFLELGYSLSAYLDHYVRIEDDAEAREFLERELDTYLQHPSLVELLELLREWNGAHPQAQVGVACVDLEWGARDVLRTMLEPYFLRLDPKVKISIARLRSQRLGSELRDRLRELLKRADQEGAEPPYPFLTPEYVGQVLTNLEYTLAHGNSTADRQWSIVRNITEHSAHHLERGFAVFKGGSFHARKRPPQTEDWWADAAYLEHEYAPTRGRVRTLLLRGVGVGFAQVAELDPTKHRRSADNYHGFLVGFRAGVEAGYARTDAYYLLDGKPLPLHDLLILRAAQLAGTEAVWVADIDGQRLRGQRGAHPTHVLQDFDGAIYVLRSQMEPTRPR